MSVFVSSSSLLAALVNISWLNFSPVVCRLQLRQLYLQLYFLCICVHICISVFVYIKLQQLSIFLAQVLFSSLQTPAADKPALLIRLLFGFLSDSNLYLSILQRKIFGTASLQCKLQCAATSCHERETPVGQQDSGGNNSLSLVSWGEYLLFHRFPAKSQQEGKVFHQ